MAITDTQKVDYLFKKLGFGVTKTDVSGIKVAPNESIASPLLLRGDRVWQQSKDIPATIPSTTTEIIEVYSGASVVECVADITASTNRTWLTSLTDWVSPEFGSTYLINVYVHTSNDAANAESNGTKLFITGSGNNDEWFFDYQSGVLNFIGDNLPNGINFSGKSVYITGARYIGSFGVGAAAGEDANLGNLVVSNNTISSVNSNANIVLDPNGTGQLVIQGTNAVTVPNGNTVQRPSGTTGDIRVNSETGNFEYYNGTDWQILSPSQNDISIIDTFSSDGSTVQFILSQSTTSSLTIVTLNGLVQSPGNAYSVSGTTLTFTEAPKTGDDIEVRYIANSFVPESTSSIVDNNTGVAANDSAATVTTTINGVDIIITESAQTTIVGNIIPESDATYNIGSLTNRWDNVFTTDLHLSNQNKPAGNDVDGTNGNWTIQEGADDLFLINNITGKRYSFVLQEIE